MSKYFFVINDEGVNWGITGTRIEMDESVVADPTLYYTVNSEDFFYTVRDLLNSNNRLSYPKTVTELTIDDITVLELDPLTVHKSSIKTQGKHFLKQRCDFVVQFDFFQFTLLNNILINAGYAITDENREAKYLEVINTGDSILIDTLDKFLGTLDRISVYNFTYNNYLTFCENVDAASTIEEVNSAFQDFSIVFS
jgi:hypothetical protein